MQKVTKEYEVFTYAELSNEAKEKARNAWIAKNDYPYLEENMLEQLKELLAKNKLKYVKGGRPLKVMYSLSHCQGDGVMFEGEFAWKKYTIYIYQSGRYYHFNSKIIEMQETKNLGFHIENEKDENAFDALYVAICKKLEKFGYDCMEAEDSEETFIAYCEDNGVQFLKDGTTFKA